MIERFAKNWNNQRDRIYRLSKEGIWIIAGKFASVIGGLFLIRVLTEHLSPAEYGELALGLTIAGLVNQVVTGGVKNGIGRFYSIASERGELQSYLNASLKLMGYATFAIGVITILLIIALIIADQGYWVGLVISVIIFSLLDGYISAINGIQNAARQRTIVALHEGVYAWLKIGLAVGVILWLGSGSKSVVIGYAISALIVTASQLFFLNRLITPKGVSSRNEGSENWAWQMWRFSWPFSVFGIFTWAQQVSDRWALEGFAATSEVGQYVVVFQLGFVPVRMLTELMTTLIGPILYQQSGAAQDAARNTSVHRTVWHVTQASLLLTALAFTFTGLFHRWIFTWLVAETYHNVSHYLPWVVLAGGLFAAGQMLSLKMMSEIRPKGLIAVKIGTAFLGVAANVMGAWFYGITGVVTALVLFSVVYIIWMVSLTWTNRDLIEC